VLPLVAKLISSNPEAYTYLSESIEAWPDQKELEQKITDAGFKSVSYKNLSFGVVALHTGER
jgi:demethylmenaquinone methyltransferase/2-methoxy-6-polyprenyl-1,4-benzoquinol methylase